MWCFPTENIAHATLTFFIICFASCLYLNLIQNKQAIDHTQRVTKSYPESPSFSALFFPFSVHDTHKHHSLLAQMAISGPVLCTINQAIHQNVFLLGTFSDTYGWTKYCICSWFHRHIIINESQWTCGFSTAFSNVRKGMRERHTLNIPPILQI